MDLSVVDLSPVPADGTAAETDAAAARRRAPAGATFRRMRRGDLGDSTPSVAEAIDELGGDPEPTPATLDDDDEWPRSISEPGDDRRPSRAARRPRRCR